MGEKKYQAQAITRHLLGALPEAEAERLDELSLTDDEFADALAAAEKDLVDAYVQGELTGAELEQFESHYLASPLRREKVEFAQAFQHMAGKEAAAQAEAARAGKSVGSAAGQEGLGRFGALLRALPSRRPALGWGAAFAALVLLAAGGWLAFEKARLRRQEPQAQANRGAQVGREPEPRNEVAAERPAGAPAGSEPGASEEREPREQQQGSEREARTRRADEQRLRTPRHQRPSPPGGGTIASFVLTPQVRSAGELPTVSIPAETDSVSMRLELEPVDYAAYQVALLHPSDNRTLWRSRRLKARAAGGGRALDVSFPAALLQPRTYVLRVSGVSARGSSEIVSDYSFRVVK